MAKRFTETSKWNDRWFVGLPGDLKLAWIYCCDQCDHAGVLEIVEPVANVQIGFEINWDDFVEQCAGRVQKIEPGKFWIKSFVDFQYGELNPENRVHKSVLTRLKKLGLSSPLRGPSKGVRTRTRTRTDKKEDVSGEGDDWVFPEGWDCPEARNALDEWVAMRRRKRKPIVSKRSTSKIFRKFDSVSHLIDVAELCESQGYQGLKPEYCRETGSGRSMTTSAQRRVENTKSAIERFANGSI
ncbi:MAG: hypothetical protein AAF539_06165 [Planctomycetota bacterium]